MARLDHHLTVTVESIDATDFEILLRAREPGESTVRHALTEVYKAISDDRALTWLTRYYEPDGDYAGSLFSGILPNDFDRITASDLFATSLLNVKIGPLATRQILDPTNQEKLSELMSRIPADASLISTDTVVWAAADEFYRLVKACLGSNPWVTASKLCARKRPNFFPVRDNVVTVKRLRSGCDWRTDWLLYKRIMADAEIVTALSRLEKEARSAISSSDLDPLMRVLDVLLWMSTPKARSGRSADDSGSE